MELKLIDDKGQATASVNASDDLFGREYNESLVHQVVTAYLANARLGNRAQKGRSDVAKSTRKPWRQKGTGRARHGSIRSPLWIGGGVTFGPRSDRNFSQKINKKMKRKALLMSLSDKVSNGSLLVLDEFAMTEYKTKRIAGLISKLPLAGSVLFVLPISDAVITKSADNIPKLQTTNVSSLNVFDVLKAGTLLTTRDGLKKMHEWLSKSKK